MALWIICKRFSKYQNGGEELAGSASGPGVIRATFDKKHYGLRMFYFSLLIYLFIPLLHVVFLLLSN